MKRYFALLASLALSFDVTALPAEFDLYDELYFPDSDIGLSIEGIDAFELSGWQARPAGDVNGDGIDDLIIGASHADPGGRQKAGRAYVLFGGSQQFLGLTIDLQFLTSEFGADGSHGFIINGGFTGGEAGTSVGAAGDINGDGFDDIAVGAVNIDGFSGHAYVIFGSAQFLPEIELLDIYFGDGSAGFVIPWIDGGSRTSWSLTGVGDINDDGLDDLAISAPAGSRAQVYVLFGTIDPFPPQYDLSTLLPSNGGDGSAGFVLDGPTDDLIGWSIAPAGDVNGDGLDDMIVGATQGWTSNRVGKVFVIYGRDDGFPARLRDTEITVPYGFAIRGFDASDLFGTSVAAAGDVNGDGLDDIVVGAPGAGQGGQSYVFFGRDQEFPPVLDVSELLEANGGNGSVGFVVNASAAGDESGTSVAGAGDFDGDGIGDLIVGAYSADFDGDFDIGEGYLVYGRADGFPAELGLDSLLIASGGDGSEGVVLRGQAFTSEAGRWVSGGLDFNDDGHTDLVVAAPGDNVDTGRTYVVYGGLDPDRDDIPNAVDNCTLAYNPSQTDTDFDGTGNRCDADFRFDCFVNFRDLADFSQNFMTSSPEHDLDDSGFVDFEDLRIVRELFFAPPGPSADSICSR